MFLATKEVPTGDPISVPTNSSKHVKTGNNYEPTIDMNLSIKKVMVLHQ